MNKYTLRQTPLAVAIGTLLAGGAVEAATITVDTLADPGVSGECSLRSAIASANSDTAVAGCAAGDGADEIVFNESLAGSAITLGSGQGQMEITGPLTITGPVPGDAAGLVINGILLSRIFHIEGDSPSEFEVGLDSLTLTGGRTSTVGAGGGAIDARNANLSLAHMMVTGNSTGGGLARGGGLRVVFGNITLAHSTVSANWTAGDVAHGGGLFVGTGNVTLNHSTVSGNSTIGHTSRGGGTYVTGGNVTLVNSTVSGNSTTGADANGGGLFVNNSSVTLTHATVAYNTAGNWTDGVHQHGATTLTLNNSLIVQADQGETACYQPADNHTNTLATDNSCTGTATDVTDITLGPLADNGGPTQTHALDAGSVAIDGAGDCQQDFDVSDDQRDEPRPGFSSTACDIGAYEFQEPYDLTPAALDFGAVRVAATAGPLTMTLSNPDSVINLGITGVGPITGPGAAAFAISADACTGITLLPGGSCDVGIEFTPDERMQFDAQVGFQFASGSAEAALTGTGIAPVMGLLPQTLDFGSVALGETGGPLSLTVSNHGDDLLQVNGLLGLGAPFSLASEGDCGALPFTLAAGEDCVLDFVFAPTGQGAAVQAVNVDSDSFGDDENFVLQGLGFSIDDEIFEDRFQME